MKDILIKLEKLSNGGYIDIEPLEAQTIIDNIKKLEQENKSLNAELNLYIDNTHYLNKIIGEAINILEGK